MAKEKHTNNKKEKNTTPDNTNKDTYKFLIILSILATVVLWIVVSQSLNKKTIKVQSNDRDEYLPQVEITTDYINIREEKNTNSRILGRVYKGEIYTIIKEDKYSANHWIKIKTNTGIKGYIAGRDGYIKYLTIKKDNEINNDINQNIASSSSSISNNSTNKKDNNINNNNNNKSYNSNKNNKSSSSKNSLPSDSSKNHSSSSSKEKKVIDAEINYYCRKGTLIKSNNTCRIELYSLEVLELVCPYGYEPYSKLNKLCKINDSYTQANIKPTEYMSCTLGDEYYFELNNVGYCRKGSKIIKRVCPTGYEVKSITVDIITTYYCQLLDSYYTREGYLKCNDNYKYDSANNICVKTIIEPASMTYSCPDDYTLEDDKCHEN